MSKLRDLKITNGVDWVWYVAILALALFYDLVWTTMHAEDVIAAEGNTTEINIVFAVSRGLFWVAVVIALGMVRLRILLRDIRRDLIGNQEVHSDGPARQTEQKERALPLPRGDHQAHQGR